MQRRCNITAAPTRCRSARQSRAADDSTTGARKESTRRVSSNSKAPTRSTTATTPAERACLKRRASTSSGRLAKEVASQNDRSRMNREVHVRFWESAGVRFHCATHLPPRLRFGQPSQGGHRALHRFLQHCTPALVARQEDPGRVLLRDAAGDRAGSLNGEHELPTASVGRYVASADRPPPWTGSASMPDPQGSTYRSYFGVRTSGATSVIQKYGSRPGDQCVCRTLRSSSTMSSAAPMLIALSATLNDGKYEPPQCTWRKSTT